MDIEHAIHVEPGYDSWYWTARLEGRLSLTGQAASENEARAVAAAAVIEWREFQQWKAANHAQ